MSKDHSCSYYCNRPACVLAQRDELRMRLEAAQAQPAVPVPDTVKPRPGLLALAEAHGARLTGKPDGSEAITIVFTIEAWRAFDAALAQPAAVPDGRLHDDGYFTWNTKKHPPWTRPTALPCDFWLAAQPVAAVPAATFDLLAHLRRHIEFSLRTFGPGPRAAGVIDHIRKELREIEAAPHDLEEWIDVLMLAMDGAWRSGASPEQIVAQLVAKQTKNEGRKWPDWRTADPGKAIEHDRTGEAAAPAQGEQQAPQEQPR